jgi:FAD-dependent urate hydroxylase
MENLKAIIIGAGMGGLTTGIALQQAGYTVEVYDRVRELRPAGAAISLWSNGIKVLNRLGLGQAIAQVGGQMDHMSYYSAIGEKLTSFSLQPLIQQVGQRPYPVTRTELQQLLMAAIEPGCIKLGAKCVAVEQDEDTVTAIFEDGHRVTGDVLIAADGTHSILRNWVAGRGIARDYVGYVNWNGLVPMSEDLAPKTSWDMYVGHHQRASFMPVGGDRFYFFLDVPLPKGTVSAPEQYRQELFAAFKDWADPVQRLIQRLDPQTTTRVEIHDTQPLTSLVQGRMALLGDAAHSMAPDLGQGGCQALEDAWVLANYLRTTTLGVTDALQRYELARRDRVANIVNLARKRSNITHGKDPIATQAWYDELNQEDGTNIRGAIAKTILGGPLN